MARINVSRTFLPPLEEYQPYLGQIWTNHYLTNQGPLLQEFEKAAADYLGVPNFQFVTNGTLALQLALRALEITGEVITTPFSYVATTAAILWERCTPIFVDIDPNTFCIDPAKIEAAITPDTQAILAVHVFGFPCDTAKIEEIAKRHNLKVIYDAAHGFGAAYQGRSLLDYGDVSICSFHATKVFQTIEGGCLVVRDESVRAKVDLMKRFGHDGDDHKTLGINAKASEFQAAMGLVNLKYVDKIIAERKRLSELYDTKLSAQFERPVLPAETSYNYGYYPILARDEQQLTTIIEKLEAEDIHPRRYFYPSLNTLPYLPNDVACPVSESIAARVLCLPLYAGLPEEVVDKICRIITT